MALQQHAIRTLLASVGLVCASLAAGQTPSTQALIGTWDMTLTSPHGTHPATFTLREEAGRVTGAVTGLPGTTPVTVSTSEADVTLSFSVEYEGQPVPVVMKGELDGTAIKGTVDYGNGQESGEFTGTKGAATAAAAAPGVAASVAGRWAITSDAPGWSMTLAQNGRGLVSGTLANGERGASLDAKGTFAEGALSLLATGPMDGQTVEIALEGTLDAGTLKGTYKVGDTSGSWTATRQP